MLAALEEEAIQDQHDRPLVHMKPGAKTCHMTGTPSPFSVTVHATAQEKKQVFSTKMQKLCMRQVHILGGVFDKPLLIL